MTKKTSLTNLEHPRELKKGSGLHRNVSPALVDPPVQQSLCAESARLSPPCKSQRIHQEWSKVYSRYSASWSTETNFCSDLMFLHCSKSFGRQIRMVQNVGTDPKRSKETHLRVFEVKCQTSFYAKDLLCTAFILSVETIPRISIQAEHPVS